MPKKIDPIERALDAYFDLDTDQRAEFHMMVKYIEKARDLMLSAPGTGKTAAVAPKIGRPKGSKNRERNVQVTEPFRGIINAASTEGL